MTSESVRITEITTTRAPNTPAATAEITPPEDCSESGFDPKSRGTVRCTMDPISAGKYHANENVAAINKVRRLVTFPSATCVSPRPNAIAIPLVASSAPIIAQIKNR